MAKRKKGGAKPAPVRRTPRRGGKQGPPTEGETSTAAEPTNSDNANQESPSEPPAPSTDDAPTDDTPASDTPTTDTPATDNTTEEDNTVTKPCQVPIVALHKKFGKYRCLFNSDDPFNRKNEVGSDSETNSSVEIKVIDPCASSESDSNTGVDTTSDTNSGACGSPMNIALNAMQSTSRDISPVTVERELYSDADQREMSPVLEIPFLCDNDSFVLNPQDVSTLLDSSIQELVEESTEPALEEYHEVPVENVPVMDQPEEVLEEVNHDIPLDDEEMMYGGDDEEIITVVQIVEDDHHGLYYDIKIDSPKEQSEQNAIEDANKDYVEQNAIESISISSNASDIQKHFESLNLAPKPHRNYQMDYSEVIDITTPPCVTPDLQFAKDENLARPDPSVTPSSTLSDDSNSSRVIEHGQAFSNDSAESSPTGVRRSSRIKTISNLKQKTKGYGLVKTPLKKALITQTKLKLEEMGSDSQERSSDMLPLNAPNSPSFPVPSEMPVKVKSRWRRSSELEQVLGVNSPASSPLASPNLPKMPPVAETNDTKEEDMIVPLSKEAYDKIIDDRMNQYQHLDENEYLCERMISKDTKKMICDCFMTKEELERGELACGEDCLNRLLMIECNSRCPVGDRCTNRRFQKIENATLKVFYADKKGCGVEAAVDISTGEFLMEYVGEVLDYELFYKRAQAYSDENNLHHYFMSLKGDTVIDATVKGNISRFINHSCEPNAETQKWTVNGELRIGFFSKRDVVAGEELTFDYQFQRFGKEAQRCYCGADNCRGWIGAEPDSDDDDDDEEEEEDVSTSKAGATESSEEAAAASAEPARPPRRSKRERKFKPKAPDLVQDADIEEDLEALSRTGVKNQSHTLRLSRTVVRAKTRRAQAALLRLLRDADLPCRRLFLDYRGLRLIAPWCSDAPLDFKWEMLQTLDRLPIPNKSMVQESRLFTVVERWLSTADLPPEPIYIDESTGLPVELPNRDSTTSPEKSKDNAAIIEKVKDLSNQLLERWASLKEVFKIPKKERIQQMKEHERQANVERRAADSSGTRDRERRDERERDRDKERERERDRERDRERERERERERDRDREREIRDRDRHRERDRERERERERERDDRERRKRRSPEGRRSIRLSDRVLAAVPPMSKEERRRAFAEAAAAAERARRREACRHYWPPEQYAQMFPPGMIGGPNNMQMMMPGMPSASLPGGTMMPGNMPGGNMMPGNMPGGPMMPGGNMLPGGMTGGNMMSGGGNMMPGGMMPGNMPGGNMMTGNMPGGNMMTGNMPGGNMMTGNMPGGIMMPGNMPGGPMMPGILPPGMTPADVPEEWLAEFQAGPQFCPPFQPTQQFCLPQANLMGMAGFGMGGFMFGQQLGPTHFPPPLQQEAALPPVLCPAAPATVSLPSLWRSALDPRGRTYYYHVKIRKPQWHPPPQPDADESSSEDEEEQVSAFDSPVVRRKMTMGKMVEGLHGIYEVIKDDSHNGLIPEHALLNIRPRKRRPGLVSERPISPRTEEDKLAGRLEVKRYKQTKEKLRRRKEKLLQKVRLLSSKKSKAKVEEAKLVELVDSDSEEEEDAQEEPIEKQTSPVPIPTVEESPSPIAIPFPPSPLDIPSPPAIPAPDPAELARKIKEQFRSSMARVMVQHLNPYRHSDAPAGRITCTADFKHLARKLTHFVMLKELKHCRSVEELVVTDSVRSKAKTFVRKYMAKFGPVYKRPVEEEAD